MAIPTSVELRDISKSFESLRVLSNVSVRINKGEFFTLLGPSGCGKTTLLRIIAGILNPDSGAVLFDGTDITNVPLNKREVGMVFQNYALFPHMNVWKNVAYGLLARKLPREEIEKRVSEALRMVKLEELSNRYPQQLSGGQQQRVALARAIAIRPKVLLLDEPLSNLDAKLREEMRFELKRLHSLTGITMIYVTHDQLEAFSMSDRIALLHNGNFQQVGSPEEIFEKPETVFVADFVGYKNIYEGVVEKIRGDGALVRVDKLGVPFLANIPLANKYYEGEKVFMAFRAEHVQLVERMRPTNSLIATVQITTYKGMNFSSMIVTQTGENIYVDTFHPLKGGERVCIYVPPENVRLLKEE
ncbi:MAG TPA: spermidine/putrescine ABC transporter ATP-binding protein [Thermotogae bacterium]|nr:spermidine/putrescine ABC transporter ATP-binding protein [Thermotogota bacterium]